MLDSSQSHGAPGALSNAFWMPFTTNRRFRREPRLIVGAEGMYYELRDGRRVLDAAAGLWCVNAGHGHPKIAQAIAAQASRLDFVSSFQMSHPAAFELADRLVGLAPEPLRHVFFSNSGSEAVDTALKLARGYHRRRGQPGRTKLIGRVRAYHGVGWGGLSVGGIGRHRRDFGPLLPDVDHLPHAYDPARMAYSRGQPAAGREYAEALLELLTLHDPSTIAAVIVEPVAGSGGVYPPPIGYLERLREITREHGILLIFDEVITGFGRLGAPFGSIALGVAPDMLTCAKGMTNGAVPMGGTLVSREIYAAFMDGPEEQIELPHGYTYSAHPLACAAALATLDVFTEQKLCERAASLSSIWQERAHALRGARHVTDIRDLGLLAAIDLAPRAGKPGARGTECNHHCIEAGMLIRTSGDSILLSPPLIVDEEQIAIIFSTLEKVLEQLV